MSKKVTVYVDEQDNMPLHEFGQGTMYGHDFTRHVGHQSQRFADIQVVEAEIVSTRSELRSATTRLNERVRAEPQKYKVGFMGSRNGKAEQDLDGLNEASDYLDR